MVENTAAKTAERPVHSEWAKNRLYKGMHGVWYAVEQWVNRHERLCMTIFTIFAFLLGLFVIAPALCR